jgi:hypothetical protein
MSRSIPPPAATAPDAAMTRHEQFRAAQKTDKPKFSPENSHCNPQRDMNGGAAASCEPRVLSRQPVRKRIWYFDVEAESPQTDLVAEKVEPRAWNWELRTWS